MFFIPKLMCTLICLGPLNNTIIEHFENSINPSMKGRHVHMEVVSLLMCIPPVTISLFPLVSITFLFKITNIHISSQSLPTIKQAVTRLKPFGCIVRQSHTEILSQEEEKIENKKTNLKIYIISFHIRTMHITGNPPEKNHDCNINYTGIQRQY